MQELAYERPRAVQDAVQMLARGAGRLLAGGTDLIPQLKEGRRTASLIVDLKSIPELATFERATDGSWRIGAAVTVGQLGRNQQFAHEYAGLLASARLIGSLQVQNRASLGGNVCNAAPSADAVPLLISLGARAEIAGPDGRRTIAVEEIAAGPGRTTLVPGEILVSLVLPPVRPRTASAYLRFTPRREMDIAVAGSGVWIELDSGGAIAAARITLASVAPTPMIAADAQQSLLGTRPSRQSFAQAAALAAKEARPISDTRGSAEYRRELVAVLTHRALTACVVELGIADA